MISAWGIIIPGCKEGGLSKYSRLDAEHEERIRSAAKLFLTKGTIRSSDIFPNKSIADGLTEPKVILPNYDFQRIVTALPFSRELYVEFCPICIKGLLPSEWVTF